MFGIYSATPPTRTLFHGTVHELQCGHVLAKMPVCALIDTLTPVVCAGVSELHAAAYGFKNKNYSSIINGQHETPIVIIGTDIQNFSEIVLAHKTYIAELPASNFREGLFTKEPQNDELPLEWYSRIDTKIIRTKCLSNTEVLKRGVQLFITDQKTFTALPPTADIFTKLLFCIKSGDEWINQSYNLGAAPWLENHLNLNLLTKASYKRPQLTGTGTFSCTPR